ncbi:MAG TPA: M48 family metalloprotease [Steroidobacteraceae bacterium]|jgi:predicted Zn-dependent protease|nr:M48 family metalloprotease [Steroidobacteraceae bacterium]
MIRPRALALLATGTLVCAGMPAHALNEAEQRARIAYEANEASHVIEELGILYGDPHLDAYLQGVTDKLYPDHKGELQIRTFKATSFNAFAMPNGRLYIHTGTLLRLKNEAELASVLGHEGAHFTGDHIYRAVSSAKVSMPILTILGAALGAPALGQLAGVSSIMGMSRDHEREADVQGFERMTRAGYDPSSGAETFRRLLRELDALKIKQPLFFASHPAVSERIANFVNLARKAGPGGVTYADEYQVQTASARVAALDGILREGNGKLLVHLLEREDLLATLPPYCRFHLAEGFRLRNDKGDAEKSLAAYRETLVAAPDYPPTYAALGKRLMHDGDKAAALPLLRKYLELDPNSVEKGFIELYVSTLEKETAQ